MLAVRRIWSSSIHCTVYIIILCHAMVNGEWTLWYVGILLVCLYLLCFPSSKVPKSSVYHVCYRVQERRTGDLSQLASWCWWCLSFLALEKLPTVQALQNPDKEAIALAGMAPKLWSMNLGYELDGSTRTNDFNSKPRFNLYLQISFVINKNLN